MGTAITELKHWIKERKEWIEDNIQNIYLFCMMAVLPLVLNNGYIDFMETKFRFFVIGTVLCFALFLSCYSNGKIQWKSILKKKQNIFFILFLVFGIVSVVISNSPIKSFVGYEGRFCGLLLYLFLGMGIILIISGRKISRISLYLIEMVIGIVALLNILNYFYIDPLGVYKNLIQSEWPAFSSTLGHFDNVGEYLSIMFAFVGTLFCIFNDQKEGIFLHIIVLACCSGAIVVNGTDGAFIGVFVFALCCPVILKYMKEIEKYFLVCIIFFSSCVGIELVSHFQIAEKRQESLGLKMRGYWQILLGIIGILFVLLICCYLFSRKNEKKEIIRGRKVYTFFLVILILLGIGLTISINSGILRLNEGSILNYLNFNDEWGTRRGYLFRIIWEGYKELPLVNKFFGIGPGMLYEWTLGRIDAAYIGSEQCSNAHNAYLHILMTHGFLGLIMWIGWMLSSVIDGFKKAKADRRFYCLCMAIVAYCATMLVGLNMLTVTVTVFIMCGCIQCELECDDDVAVFQAAKLCMLIFLVWGVFYTVRANGDTIIYNMLYGV